MSNHTPGNWIDWNDEEDNWLLVQEDSQQVIAMFPKGDTESTKDESLANCQLCAAAPELLEVVRLVRDWLDDGITDDRRGETERAIFLGARAAIAKAEGKSHE